MTGTLEAVAAELSAKVRTDPAGVKSLAHVLAVVPTRQSGRRLRCALARRLGAMVPPAVKTTASMFYDENDETVAGRTDELLAFKAAGKDYPLARQLSDVRSLLLPAALSFADVAKVVAADFPEDGENWNALAELEKEFVAALARRGKRDRIEAAKEWAAKSAAEKWPEIEEIVRYDDPEELLRLCGCDATVDARQIFPAATAVSEAEAVADYFSSIKDGERMSALSVVDPELFPEVVAQFKARGMKVHNPSQMKLTTSSLGRLVQQVAAMAATRSYAVFSAFVRGGDVRRWISSRLKLTDAEIAEALVDLDNRQAELIPEHIEDIAPKTQGKLRAIFELVTQQLSRKNVRGLLAEIFRERLLDESDAGDREFAAAAEALDALLEECSVDSGPDGAARLDMELFAIRLEETCYSLECAERDAIVTDGWMELAFLDADELVVAGFCEGCVPESTLGHPFLPDALRARLGLPCNASRERRDRAILKLAVGPREKSAVRFHFHSIGPGGEMLKPSRLLLETPDDGDFIKRVKRLYRLGSGTQDYPAKDLPGEWKLRLPVPPREMRLEKLSPTRLDSYLSCPFTYYLKDKSVLGDRRQDAHAEELAAWEFGNLAHEALEAFGRSECATSTDPGEIAAFLGERVDERLGERFGSAVPAIVAMQGESVKRRLANFAVIQAERRAAGWRIVDCERKLSVVYGHTRFSGRCDRIDFNELTGEWCVIDYKAWDSAAKALCYDERKKKWLRLQLPIYCAMLDADGEGIFAEARLERISAAYCVLGKTREEVVFAPSFHGGRVAEAEREIRRLIGEIERGIFWPPSGDGDWRYDYGEWLMPSPEESIDEKWIEDQLARQSAN